MFNFNSNPNIFNPAITQNSRVYFNAPNGQPYINKIYNPNDSSTKLPYNVSQNYTQGTPKYYQNLSGLNSSKFQRDEVLGRTVYTESGRPVLIKKESTVNIPQVKYDYNIPLDSNWGYMDFCEIDQNSTKNNVNNYLKRNFNIPMEKDIKQPYSNNNPGELQRIMNKENINNILKRNQNLNNNKETFVDKAKNLYSNYIITNSISYNRETFNNSTLKDTDILYREMIRSYAKAISFYLNNNPKYRHWKKNWQILENNLNKTDLLVERLDENDEDIAYTENKGEVIRFRWRDSNKYIPKNVFLYVLLHELTHQIFPPSFQGHGHPFPDMLCIISVAALELNLFDLSKIPAQTIYTNGQPIGSRESLKEELYRGIELLQEKNKGSDQYYKSLLEYIN